MRRILRIVLLLNLWMAALGSAWAYYVAMTRSEMIEQAEAIAVVVVGPVQEVRDSTGGGRLADYGRSLAPAQVEQVIKGQLPTTITIWGGRATPCVGTSLRQGKCLIFLQKSDGHYRSLDFDHSIFWVSHRGTIQWPTPKPLGTAIEEIQRDLKRLDRPSKTPVHH